MILPLFVILAFCTIHVGALYADVDVTLHIHGLESLTTLTPGWYQLESQAWVYSQEGKKSIAAVPLFVKDLIGAQLPLGFKTPASINVADYRCFSKLFLVPEEHKSKHYAVNLNEVYGLRLTLPASIAVLNSMGLFVQLSLYRENATDGDGTKGGMEYIGSKVVRVGNVLAGVNDYTELPIEDNENQCNVSLHIHAGLNGLHEPDELYDPPLLEPGREFHYWRKKLKDGDNSILYEWFKGADVEELDKYVYKYMYSVPRRVFDNFLRFTHRKDANIAGTKIGTVPVCDAIRKDNQYGPTPISTADNHSCVECQQHLFESLFNAFAKLFAQRLLQTLVLSSGNDGSKGLDYLEQLGDQEDLKAFQFLSKESLKDIQFDGTIYRVKSQYICDCGAAASLNVRLNQFARGLGAAVAKNDEKNIVYIGLENYPGVILKVEHEEYTKKGLQEAYKLFIEKFKPLTDRLSEYWEQYVDASLKTSFGKGGKKYWTSLKKYMWDIQGKEKPTNLKMLHDEYLTQNLMDEHHFFLMHTRQFATIDGNVFSKKLELKNQHDHLLVLVHGEGEETNPLQQLQDNLEVLTGFTHVLKVPVNPEKEKTMTLTRLGNRLYNFVDDYLQENPRGRRVKYISFLGHSYGGLVIRAALPRLRKYQRMFYAIVTIATPHLGYPHVHSTETNAGKDNICNAELFDCEAKKQVGLQDHKDKKQTLLYRLCLDDSIKYFKVVRFFGVEPDSYCPAWSALLQTECITDENDFAHVMAGHLRKNIREDGFGTVKLNYRLAASYIAKPTCTESHAAMLHQKVQTRLLVALTSDIF